eukprot:c10109_g1_i1.p1 GENE.c10109_g1_i1~~c10109_g1_i1.p1  ORF type:complete len:149 (+),score=24.10 c10109_g1_i1:46-492(+)
MADSTFPPAYDEGNIFRKILDGQIPCYKIFETDACVAILDAFPCAAGHSLLVTKGAYATVADMPPAVAADYFSQLPRLMNAVAAATGAHGCNVFHNAGRASGQVVFHAHVHVVPRFEGDGIFHAPQSASSMIEGSVAKDMLERIQSNL